jgi:hypothetical protein
LYIDYITPLHISNAPTKARPINSKDRKLNWYPKTNYTMKKRQTPYTMLQICSLNIITIGERRKRLFSTESLSSRGLANGIESLDAGR